MRRLLVWLSTPVGIMVVKLTVLAAALLLKSKVSPLGDPKNRDAA